MRADPGSIAQLRSALWSAGYQTEKISELLGADRQHLQPDPAQAVLLRRQLPPGAPLSTLIRLFLLGLSEIEADVTRALAPLSLERATDMGLLVAGGDGNFRGGIRLVPYGEFLFACSRVPDLEAIDSDHVMGVTRSSINLANLTIRRPVDLALDLGAGCGFQSLFASRHATRVIATDINPRALELTELNARLNGVDNVECREGSYLDPVREETFDLVVSNPPFVISPDSSFLYRDSGLPGDDLSKQVVRDIPSVLRPGGTATVMVSWGRKVGDEWDARPRKWVEGIGCDAWILHQASQPSLLHAASWHQPLAGRDLVAYDAGVERWTRYLDELGFESVAYGAVVLRRRAGNNWVRSEDLPETETSPASDQLLRMTAAQDLLADLPDRRRLLDERFVLVSGHRLDQTLHCRNGSYTVERAFLQLTEGLVFRANVDPFNAFLVTRLDGVRTLREAIAEAAEAATPAGLDADDVEAAALRSIRRMLELGFVERFGVQ